jgi:large subunit ribosomal protein L21
MPVYAVIQTGGKQYRVEPGQVVAVDKLAVQEGEDIVFEQVLLAADGDNFTVGNPVIAGAKVTGKVLDQFRTRKVLVFKYKAKEHYRRLTSSRRAMTRIRIESVTL